VDKVALCKAYENGEIQYTDLPMELRSPEYKPIDWIPTYQALFGLNFVVKNEFFDNEKDLLPHLFGDEAVIEVPTTTDMFDLLVLLGAFVSKSEARKNWKKSDREIPLGFNEFAGIGKARRALCVWNPVNSIGR
jgi:hypothetical protein